MADENTPPQKIDSAPKKRRWQPHKSLRNWVVGLGVAGAGLGITSRHALDKEREFAQQLLTASIENHDSQGILKALRWYDFKELDRVSLSGDALNVIIEDKNLMEEEQIAAIRELLAKGADSSDPDNGQIYELRPENYGREHERYAVRIWDEYNLHPEQYFYREALSPLHVAVRSNRTQVALELMAQGAKPDDIFLTPPELPHDVLPEGFKPGALLLHEAIANDNPELTKKLMDMGVRLAVNDETYHAELSLAAQYAPKVMPLLLSTAKGLKPHTLERYLEEAQEHRNVGGVYELIRAGAAVPTRKNIEYALDNRDEPISPEILKIYLDHDPTLVNEQLIKSARKYMEYDRHNGRFYTYRVGMGWEQRQESYVEIVKLLEEAFQHSSQAHETKHLEKEQQRRREDSPRER